MVCPIYVCLQAARVARLTVDDIAKTGILPVRISVSRFQPPRSPHDMVLSVSPRARADFVLVI